MFFGLFVITLIYRIDSSSKRTTDSTSKDHMFWRFAYQNFKTQLIKHCTVLSQNQKLYVEKANERFCKTEITYTLYRLKEYTKNLKKTTLYSAL